MKSIRQIEEQFRELDTREGRVCQYYEPSKLSKLKNITKPSDRYDPTMFWDVLRPSKESKDDSQSNQSLQLTVPSSKINLGINSTSLGPLPLYSSQREVALERKRLEKKENEHANIARRRRKLRANRSQRKIRKRMTVQTQISQHYLQTEYIRRKKMIEDDLGKKKEEI